MPAKEGKLKGLRDVIGGIPAEEVMELVGVDEDNVMELLDEAYRRAKAETSRALEVPDIDRDWLFRFVAVLYCSLWRHETDEVMDIAYQLCTALPAISQWRESQRGGV